MVSVILVEPLYAGNVGAVARVMKNFGFKELVLVNPCKIDAEAGRYAVHAKDILKSAKKLRNFEAARRKFDFLLAFSAVTSPGDEHFLRIPVPANALKCKLSSLKGKIGLVFGREDVGLLNEEIEKCDLLVRVPTSKDYESLNLSHAVAIALYEASKIKQGKIRIATRKENMRIEQTISDILEKLPKIQKKHIVLLMLRRILARSVLSGREAHTLLGLLKEIKERLK